MIKGNKEIRKNGKKMLLVAGCWLLVKLFQEFHTVNFI